MDQVLYRRQLITLDPNKVIGSGGEANIIKHGKIAFKIYHEPSKYREQKLLDFLNANFKWPENVMGPLDIVKSQNGKQIIGFIMNIADKCKDAMNLSNTKFRQTQQVNTNNIITFFTDAKLTLDIIHKLNVVVGDFNDLNLLFNSSFKSIFIDVDSFQFDKYPCIVGTDSFIDPDLYGVDLTKKPSFSRQTDWYSFAVMLFKSLFFVHPYGGTNKTYKTLYTRAQNNVWVFDKNVTYPIMGLHPETIDDETLHYFAKIFCKKQRIDLPIASLQNLENSFIECTSCHTFYHKSRIKCPQCQKTTIQPTVDLSAILTTKQVGKEACEMSILFSTKGTILFSKVIDDTVIVISYDNNDTILTIITTNSTKTHILWHGFQKHFVYDYFLPSYLVVGKNEEIIIFNVILGQLALETKTFAGCYNDEIMFTCDDTGVYRLTSNMIMRGEFDNNNYVEREITPAIENQTWIRISQKGLGLGFYRIFSQYKFFVFTRDGNRYEVQLSNLPGQLIDIDVKFSISTILLLRKTLHNGRTFSHWHIIDNEGKVLETKSEESINSDLLKTIYGKAFAGSNIIHATDAGIVIEKHGVAQLKSSTVEFVNEDTSLSLFKQGLLAISSNKIMYIIMK